ncbi:hypothetical protein [Pseudomonas sp. ALK-5]
MASTNVMAMDLADHMDGPAATPCGALRKSSYWANWQ